jgi:hypothetical protein
MAQPPAAAPARPRQVPAWLPLLGGALIFVNLLWFGRDAFRGHFAPDDMMNLAGYWRTGWWGEIAANLLVFTGSFRPMGALFYLPLYRAFGLHPLPFHVVAVVVMVANTWLVYRLVRLLTESVPAALVAAFLVSYQTGMANLYYDTAVIYDVLCFFFFFAALNWYVSIRRRGARPGWRQIAGLAGLYACALNSKEMAVSLPLVLLGYELCFHGFRWQAMRTVAVTGAMTVAFIASKLLGPDALSAMPAYQPVFTWQKFVRSTSIHLDLITHQHHLFNGTRFLLLWAILLAAALVRKRPELRFCWWTMLVTPLPVVFIDRSLSCIYIPYAAWTMFAAVLATAPGERGRWKLAAVLSLALIAWQVRRNTREKDMLQPTIDAHGARTALAIRQIETLHPAIRPHSHAIFLNDPFAEYDMLFIAELWLGDRTVEFHLQRKDQRTPEELAKMDYVFRFEPDGRLVQVKP